MTVFFRLLFIVGVAGWVFTGCQKEPSTLSPASGKIVFLSNRESPKRQFDIFIKELGDSTERNLTRELETVRSISHPALSPDGQKVLFVAFEKTGPKIDLLDVESLAVHLLADPGFDGPRPSFSPDGNKILFVKKVNDHKQIYLVNADGTEETNLSNNNYDESEPTFSPDGAKIAFVSNRDGSKSIWIMNSDGSSVFPVTDKQGTDGHPSFSPDGNKLVFQSFRGGRKDSRPRKTAESLEADGLVFHSARGEVFDIWMADLKKRTFYPIVESNANNYNPYFSPDGKKILYLSNFRGMKYRDVVVSTPKGKKQKAVSQKINVINQNATFSPDGKKIIFESTDLRDSEIYIVDTDGENLTNLTNHPRWDCLPSF